MRGRGGGVPRSRIPEGGLEMIVRAGQWPGHGTGDMSFPMSKNGCGGAGVVVSRAC